MPVITMVTEWICNIYNLTTNNNEIIGEIKIALKDEGDDKKIIKAYREIANSHPSIPLAVDRGNSNQPIAICVRRGKHRKKIAKIIFLKRGWDHHTEHHIIPEPQLQIQQRRCSMC